MSSKHVLAKKPWHIEARPGDIAEKVLTAGDPGRVAKISTLLDDPLKVSDKRGFLVYTGVYRGCKVSVVAHGIGAPSAAIVFEELHMLGANVIIRLGTCGGLVEHVKLGGIVIPVGALFEAGGTVGIYVKGTCYPAVPEPELVIRLEEAFRKHGFETYRGIVASSDAFHAEEHLTPKWRSLKAVAVEMECATLFTLSRLRGFKSGAALMVIDNLATGIALKKEEIDGLELKAAKAALDALVSI
ncbi:MAG: purine-nucleoside phosphorylase [Thermoproteales archaeon]|nr:purine-nucleoside phosphorylase [Thermoproteales archaeon]